MKRDFIFWAIIAGTICCVSVYYVIQEDISLLPLAFIPVVGLIAFYYAAKIKNRDNVSITTWPEFVITNTIFLGTFILSLFFLKPEYVVIKILLFIVFSAVGTYNSITYFRAHRN